MSSHIEVARAWAQRNATTATVGYAMQHDGTAIYSWGRHFMIARHIRGLDGKDYTLYTMRDYSSSTAKHKSVVRNVLDWGSTIIVPDPATFNVVDSEKWDEHLMLAAGQAYREIMALLPTIYLRYKRARVWKNATAHEYKRMLDNMQRLCDAFLITMTAELPEDIKQEIGG
jgi:hypothetical protein